jgi:plastocyanin
VEKKMRFKHFQMPLMLLGLAALGFAAAWPPTTAWAAEETQTLIKDFKFTPVSVKAGTKVTWVNMDDEPHNVVSDAGLFRSSGLDTNESFSYTFDKPGTYQIHCSIHPRRVATVVVE